MAAIPYRSDIDLNRNIILNQRLENRTSAHSSPRAGMIYFDSQAGVKRVKVYDDVLAAYFDVPRLDQANTVTGLYTFNRGAGVAPFAVGDATLVTNLNADYLDGKDSDVNATANTIALRDGNGCLNVSDPTSSSHAVSLNYLTAAMVGRDDPRAAVDSRTTAPLPANTRVGNVLTANSNGALPAQNGVTLTVGMGLLVKDEVAAQNNGPMIVTQVGDSTHPWILTRRADADTSAEVTHGMYLPDTNDKTFWLLTTADPITLNTSALTFAFAGGGSDVEAGTGLYPSGVTLNVGTADSGRIVVNADNIDLALTGVGSGTYGQVTVDTWGRVTAAAAICSLSNGGTGGSLTAANGGLVWSNATNMVITAALTGVLQGNGAAAPTAITGTGGKLVKWGSAAPYLADSLVSESGSVVTIAGSLTLGANPLTSGAIISSGTLTLSLTSNNQIVLNSGGSNFGFVSNPSSGVWALGYGTAPGTLGSSALTWNSSGNVTVAGTLSSGAITATGTSSFANITASGTIAAANTITATTSGTGDIQLYAKNSSAGQAGIEIRNTGAFWQTYIPNAGTDYRVWNTGAGDVLKLTTGGLATFVGNIGVGTAAVANIAGLFRGTQSGDNSAGLKTSTTLKATANNQTLNGYWATDNLDLSNGGTYTGCVYNGVAISNPALVSGTPADVRGISIGSLTRGSASNTGVYIIGPAGSGANYGLYITAPSGGTTNIAIWTDGTISCGAITGGIYNGQTISSAANFTGTMTVAGIVTFTNATNATATNTGAVVMTGGLALAKDIYGGGILTLLGGNASVLNASTTAASTLTLQCGDGTTSGKLTYVQLIANQTSPQEWRAGMLGGTVWKLRDQTAGHDMLTIANSTGNGIVFGNWNVGGALNMTGSVNLAAGSTSLAPLVFQSGTLLTSIATGAVEYDGADFYGSPTSGNRYKFALKFSATITNGATGITGNPTSATSIQVAHNRGTKSGIAGIRNLSTDEFEFAKITAISTSAVQIDTNDPLGNSAYELVFVG